MQAKREEEHTNIGLRSLAQDALTSEDALVEFGERIDMRVERIGGKLVVTPPMGFDGARREMRLIILVGTWAEAHGYAATSPSGNYRLPEGDVPAPDVGLVRQDRVDVMSAEERGRVARLVPDIVVELLSESQCSPTAVAIERAKCERWFKAGAGYVVLIDPFTRKTMTWGDVPPGFPDFGLLFDPPRP